MASLPLESVQIGPRGSVSQRRYTNSNLPWLQNSHSTSDPSASPMGSHTTAIDLNNCRSTKPVLHMRESPEPEPDLTTTRQPRHKRRIRDGIPRQQDRERVLHEKNHKSGKRNDAAMSRVRKIEHQREKCYEKHPQESNTEHHLGVEGPTLSGKPEHRFSLWPGRLQFGNAPELMQERPSLAVVDIASDFGSVGTEAAIDLKGKRGWRQTQRERAALARSWQIGRKRLTALTACVNIAIIGFLIGVYSGEVPRIQYQVVDLNHYVPLGNVYLFIGLAFSTFILWTVPLLHGRKMYTLAGMTLALALQLPQAIIVSSQRSPSQTRWRESLLACRGITGLALGFVNVNSITTLFDLFGSSLQSEHPHQENIMPHDLRRQGGGFGFLVGAEIIAEAEPTWGFYSGFFILTIGLLLNVVTPETRRAPFRKTGLQTWIGNGENTSHKIALGEVRVHVWEEPPNYWHEEAVAGIALCWKMLRQLGFLIMAVYLGWVYAQIILIIILLGALLSREYRFRPQWVGLGVASLAVGALLSVPLSKANILSKARRTGARTDSMTFQEHLTWTSHLARRIVFMTLLPISGGIFAGVQRGTTMPYIIPVIFAAMVGFCSNLAVAECYGIIMETYDTSDLQPGINSRHRLKSLDPSIARRRTNYSSFPRVTAGIFASQSIGYLLAAAATATGGYMTRNLGSQLASGITAAILLFLTLLLTITLWRFEEVRVIPDGVLHGSLKPTDAEHFSEADEWWKPVIIGNPSGKYRRMNVLELGRMSRWSEIRRLNKLTWDTN